MSLASTMAAAHVAQRKQFGIEVEYSRGARAVTLTVVPGRTRTELANDDHSATVNSYIRDYLILASDLVLCGEAIRPKPGDAITDGDVKYEVTRSAGEPGWRWSDPGRQVYRVHVQQVKDAPL